MMWARNSLLLLGILLIACQSDYAYPEPGNTPAGATQSSAPTETTPPVNNELQQMAAEFRSFRDIPGHFGGGPRNAEVDEWQGRKHQLMLALGDRLGDGTFGRDQLVALLGSPDHVVTTGEPLMPYIASLPNYANYAGADAFLVYEWRGTHDFLFFILQEDRIVGADWWYAYE